MIIIDDYLIDKSHINFKKATWHKWLIGSKLNDLKIKVDNVCSIDSDFLINPFSPNIFSNYNEKILDLFLKEKIYHIFQEKIFLNVYLSLEINIIQIIIR